MAEVDINQPNDKFSPYHNLTTYLVKGKKSEGFDDMIDFLCRSKIHHALTVNPTIYIPHMEDFWNSAVYSTEQGIPQIKAKVDDKDITITEANLRKHLKLQDEGAAISYSKEEYMRTFVSIGYTGNQNEYTIEKALMAPTEVSMPHSSTMHIPEEKWMASRVNVPLLSTMMNMQSTQGDSSAIPADTDPTPSTSNPEQQFASLVRSPVQTTKDARAQKLLTPILDVIVSQLEQRAPVAAKYTRKRSKKTPSILVSKAQSQPKSPHSESQNSDENIKRDSQKIRETSLEVSLLGSGSHPGSIEQPTEPFHFSSLKLSAEAPCQDDIPSPTTIISEVLIDLAANAPNPSSSPKKVHSRSDDRVNVERAVTTSGSSTDQEDSDNIIKTLTTATHSEDVSFETLFTERNPRCQENQGDGDTEARPKAPFCSKDSTAVDEDRLKLHNLELTARGEIVAVEDDADSLDEWIQEQTAFQSSLFRPAFVQVHDLPNSVDEEEEITEDWKLAPRRLDLIRSSTLTEEEVVCWRRFLYNTVVRDLEVLGWSSTGSSDFTFFLSKASSLSININEILHLNSDFLHKVFELRTHICNLNSFESQAMIKTIKARLEKEGRLAMYDSDSDSDLSFLSSPTVRLNTEEESKRREKEKVKKEWKAVTGFEWEEHEESVLPLSIPQTANEAEAEIPIASLTSAVVVHEAEAEASSKDNGKGLMTEEAEERLLKEKKEREKRRREREEEEMAELRKAQERKAAILLKEQQI
ncbi:hypothetical protein L1987_53806 [Smallanthus sonchifolius]|uniref:Uncharacterized protein n=1 Tax=Smallanthus sonchifolius TaxID=185202 RepID=A0ACB9EWX7_9ASTR|nr:hypothetical protein L1987_53806 [Smallanthus sonchifolius]